MTTEQNLELGLARHRAELLAHCYRMVGSYSEAEDLVQECLLRAWRSRADFDERRASWRTWLYRIATNLCLDALRSRPRRALPAGLGPASEDALAPLAPSWEIPWLEPIPAAGYAADPAVVLEAQSSLRLALVAAFQTMPPKQRAVLILRDVLAFTAEETAGVLQTTVAAANSALQRARERLGQESIVDEALTGPANVPAIIDEYVRAFERGDVAGIVKLLSDDVLLEMPPVDLWYRGVPNYRAFMERVFSQRGSSWRTVRTEANGQPAFAAYSRGPDSEFHLHTLQVLEIVGGRVRRNDVFADPRVLRSFDLAPVLPAG
ncbi:RNA polymerase subunit sigma-70 [Jatrophihabitans sp.]|uniref:RNA polymerase subunit sigma-70 n=1 Tax=Jatrophihabitans sp. TaxID=1932789 RepID=UPI002BA4041E|nr:RNA polymerase subunit sigma-70 [Jatrophihabitans sp.]